VPQKVQKKKNRPWRPWGGVGVKHYFFFSLGAKCGWVINVTSQTALHGGRRPDTRCTGSCVGPQGLSGRVRKNLPPSGFDFQTFQSVAIRCARPCYRLPFFISEPSIEPLWLLWWPKDDLLRIIFMFVPFINSIKALFYYSKLMHTVIKS